MNKLICISQAIIVIGWFWLIIYTIYRAENFKKRYFSVLIAIYFIHGVLKVAELIQYETDPDAISTLSIISNVLCIFGFVFLTERYIKFKIYFDEKVHSNHIDGITRAIMRGTESPKV